MRVILFTLIFLSVFEANAQQKGKITYELVVTKNPDKKKTKMPVLFDLEGNALLLNKTELEIFFDNENSYFPPITFEEDNMAVSHFPLDEEIFISNKNKAAYIPIEFEGKQALEKIDNYNWKIRKESKKIGRYTVYKATAKDHEREIIAWYAPEFPYSYGPVDVFGLPGLILEVAIKDEIIYVYQFKSLQLNEKQSVKQIPELKIIEEKELTEYYKEYYKNLKDKYKK